MKPVSLIISAFSVVMMLGVAVPAAAQERLVRSVERQFDSTSAAIEKSSQPQASVQGSGAHQAKQSAVALSKPVARHHEVNLDYWIYDAWLTLNVDQDYDTFYSYFTLEFDVDSIYQHTDVYARLYLTRGEVYHEYHTTSVFSVNGEDSQDSLIVESELLNGFVPDEYDLLIEVYDAYDDTLLATLDAFDDADLAMVSLESVNYETTEEVVVVVEEHGGAATLLLGILAAVFGLRRMRKPCWVSARQVQSWL